MMIVDTMTPVGVNSSVTTQRKVFMLQTGVSWSNVMTIPATIHMTSAQNSFDRCLTVSHILINPSETAQSYPVNTWHDVSFPSLQRGGAFELVLTGPS